MATAPIKKVAYLGHSYVRDLESLGHYSGDFSDTESYLIDFFYIPGSKFLTWLDHPNQLQDCIDWKPDYLVVVLGGNSIVEDISDKELQEHCCSFFKVLRESLPRTILIATQVELRFNKVPNWHNAPGPEEFRKRRNKFNYFLRFFKEKNFLALIAGPGRLDNETLYRDSVHLNDSGLLLFSECLARTVSYAHVNRHTVKFE